MPLSLRLAFLKRVTLITALCLCRGETASAQSESSSPTAGGDTGRLFAQPDLGRENPFAPSKRNNVELPVSIAGFSAVALRDQQQWLPGSPRIQLVFDGQIYWFSDERDRDIFAANPQEYAPVLGGDCVVTYAHTGKRTLGKLEYGLVHARRIYFFSGEAERDQFRSRPQKYANSDLAYEGKCLVSRVDQGLDIVGQPATAAVVKRLALPLCRRFSKEPVCREHGPLWCEATSTASRERPTSAFIDARSRPGQPWWTVGTRSIKATARFRCRGALNKRQKAINT